MTWLGKLVSSVIIFFSGVVGTSHAPAVVPVAGPADVPRTVQTIQEPVAVQVPAATTSKKKEIVAHPVQTLFPQVHTAELPICPSKTATNCRHVEGTSDLQSNAPKGCSGTGTVALQSPMNIEDVGVVIPMGEM